MKTASSVDIVREGDVAIVSFTSRCISDVEQITDASSRVNRHVQENPPREIIFDFSGVKFFSSQVLGLLLEARGHVKQHGGQVTVCGLDPQLHRVFRITNLDRIFTFYPDRQTALSESAVRDR
ncbi:MAG TPA: STAS domain-containing protein [Sedimentisphaerales bacterium]|nr:STAS domain-containing protein [Sedimentisphaerales bacterium]HRS11940.1 STAS domain-containing protein [Sedimentisphaerales bacterium]HRV48617.1 STAS domain-containing protein [Sedimentisphaerales bacterium]